MLSDINFHLPPVSEDVDLQLPKNRSQLFEAIDKEYNIVKYDYKNIFESAVEKAKKLGIANTNFMLLDSNALNLVILGDLEIKKGKNLFYTFLVSPYEFDDLQLLSVARSKNVHGIKFHPYLQKLGKNIYPEVFKLAIEAQNNGMWVAVDCSYGTDKVYEYNGVDLCAYLLSCGFKGQLIALHFGGPRVLDMMSLMAQHDNIYADLSLSLSYWKGSSVWQDLNFLLNRVGHQRVLFGSDQPFIQFNKAVNDLDEFLGLFNISDEKAEDIKHNNFLAFISG